MAAAAEVMFRSMNFANKLFKPQNVNNVFNKEQIKTVAVSRFYATAATEKDPAPVFFNYDVQRLLKRLTKPDPKKVFRKKLDGRSVATPEFKFMTDEDLEDAMKTAERRMYYFLQMPPVVKVQSDEVEILSKDPEIKNHDTSKFVFTDITFAVKNQDRLVTVREPDGTLRNANNDERKRMLQVYFPFQGREMFPPKMFDGEYFQDLLDRQEYEFILMRTVVQYDPNEKEWMRITHAVYHHINENRTYEKLISTRFYGPMVFHYAWNKDIDNLLLEHLKNRDFNEAAKVVQLYHLVHPDCESVKLGPQDDVLTFIEQYAKTDAKNKSRLQTAVNVGREWRDAQKQMEENVKQAHGVE